MRWVFVEWELLCGDINPDDAGAKFQSVTGSLEFVQTFRDLHPVRDSRSEFSSAWLVSPVLVQYVRRRSLEFSETDFRGWTSCCTTRRLLRADPSRHHSLDQDCEGYSKVASIRRAEQFHRLLHIQFSVPQLNRGIAKSSECVPVLLLRLMRGGIQSSSGVYISARISTRGPRAGTRGFQPSTSSRRKGPR